MAVQFLWLLTLFNMLLSVKLLGVNGDQLCRPIDEHGAEGGACPPSTCCNPSNVTVGQKCCKQEDIDAAEDWRCCSCPECINCEWTEWSACGKLEEQCGDGSKPQRVRGEMTRKYKQQAGPGGIECEAADIEGQKRLTKAPCYVECPDSTPAAAATNAAIVIFVSVFAIFVLGILLLIYLYKYKKESIPLGLADRLDKFFDKSSQTLSKKIDRSTIEMEEGDIQEISVTEAMIPKQINVSIQNRKFVINPNGICLKAIIDDVSEEDYKNYQFKWHSEELQTTFPFIKISGSNERSINIADIPEGSHQISVEVKQFDHKTNNRGNEKDKFKKIGFRKSNNTEIGSGVAKTSFAVYPETMVKCDPEEFRAEKFAKIEIGARLWMDKKSEIKDFPDFLKEAVFFQIPRKGLHKDISLSVTARPNSTVYIAWRGGDGFAGLEDIKNDVKTLTKEWTKVQGKIEHESFSVTSFKTMTQPYIEKIWKKNIGPHTSMILPKPTGKDISAAIFVMEGVLE